MQRYLGPLTGIHRWREDGVDPRTGVVTQPRHPQHRESLAGRIVALPAAIGSSSSSSVLLELIDAGHAPAALLLAEPDAVLCLGSIVARELALAPVPILHGVPEGIEDGAWVRVRPGGVLEPDPG